MATLFPGDGTSFPMKASSDGSFMETKKLHKTPTFNDFFFVCFFCCEVGCDRIRETPKRRRECGVHNVIFDSVSLRIFVETFCHQIIFDLMTVPTSV